MSILQTQDVTDTAVEEVVDSTDRGVAEISQFRLMARRFKKSKLSVFALIVLAIMYVIMIFAPFFMVNQALEISSDAKEKKGKNRELPTKRRAGGENRKKREKTKGGDEKLPQREGKG